MKTLFEICTPRSDILKGNIRESDFAADLAQVINGTAPIEYTQPHLFFANTHPTQGFKALLKTVCQRLQGVGGSAVLRLDTQYGGGKTHSLIALTHAAQGMKGVNNIAEFIDPNLVPTSKVRLAAFDGENADPVNGRPIGDGLRAYTPWGELAYGLAGVAGYEKVRQSDIERVAPGADTIRELFDNEPVLILLDELSIYLRKIKGRKEQEQLTPFMTALFKAVSSSAQACVVFTWDAFEAPRFPYDEALRLARVVGVDLDREIVGYLAQKQSSDLILWDSSQRSAKASLGSPDGSRAMIDALHHAANHARSNSLEAAKKLLESNQVDQSPDFQTALLAALEVLPVSSTYTGFAEEEGEVAEAAKDFDVLESLRRLAFSEKVARPKQLELWLNKG